MARSYTKWLKIVLRVLLALVAFAALLLVAFVALMYFAFGAGGSGDDFAKDLVIPAGVEVAEPIRRESPREPRELGDPFQTAVLAALLPGDPDDASVVPDLSGLIALQRESPEILERYLAAHPDWRVHRAFRGRFAVRRPGPRVHAHVRIGLSGTPLYDRPVLPSQARFGEPVATLARSGEAVQVHLNRERERVDSYLVTSAGPLVVEVDELSEQSDRRLTQAVLDALDQELGALRGASDWPALRATLGEGAVRRGETSFDLYHGMQPGMFESELWVNPGEPGMIYLRAFEITREYRLSQDRLTDRSNEWVGWSDDPGERFFANAHFTIYEGDWGQPYAARFEVWFVPDAGGPERKLFERIYRIEGWMR